MTDLAWIVLMGLAAYIGMLVGMMIGYQSALDDLGYDDRLEPLESEAAWRERRNDG